MIFLSRSPLHSPVRIPLVLLLCPVFLSCSFLQLSFRQGGIEEHRLSWHLRVECMNRFICLSPIVWPSLSFFFLFEAGICLSSDFSEAPTVSRHTRINHV